MTRFKRLILWLVIGTVVASVAGYILRQSLAVQAQKPHVSHKLTPLEAFEANEWTKMRINLDLRAGIPWKYGLKHAMLKKANWLANRLNLPIKRPIYATDVQGAWLPHPSDCVLRQYPSWLPDTVFGTNIFNSNIPRRARIKALKIAVNGALDTPSDSGYEFHFLDGQLMELVRLDVSEGENYSERYVERMHETQPSPTEAAQAYQLATNWLAALDVNLAMLDKSRLPHSVHEGEYQPDGAPHPMPVYFVDWGTNYYGLYYIYKTWHTNHWHPAVTVEIGPNKELLELYVGDYTFYRDPPMLINSDEVWRLIHTPDLTLQQLQNPIVTQALGMTPSEVSYFTNEMFPPMSVVTNGMFWKAAHNLLPPGAEISYSNDVKWIHSITNGVW